MEEHFMFMTVIFIHVSSLQISANLSQSLKDILETLSLVCHKNLWSLTIEIL